MSALHLQIRQVSVREVSSVVSSPSGPPGTAGASIEIRGQWAAATNYVYRDIAYNAGSSYICRVNHTGAAGTEPGVGANWETVWEGFAVSSINDAGASATGTWSSNKITTELATKANTTHNQAANTINSGTFDNARIAASNVTQYAGSINHNALLNYSVNQHRTIDDGSVGNTDLWSAAKIAAEVATKANTSHTHPVSSIEAGVFDPGFIPQVGVTQHQSAITHGNIAGLDGNHHNKHPSNTISTSMFSAQPNRYRVPTQNVITGEQIGDGLFGLNRAATFDSVPANTQLNFFEMSLGSTFLGGWIDSNGSPINGAGNPASPSGDMFVWNRRFVIGGTGALWMQNKRQARFYEDTAFGVDYVGIRSPDNLTGTIEYQLPQPATQEGAKLSTGFGSKSGGILSWEPQTGTAFPAAGYNGQRFYRTDLEESFSYDDGTAFSVLFPVPRWISEEVIPIEFGRVYNSPMPATVSLNGPGNGATTATAGFYLEHNYFIISAVVTSTSDFTGTFQILRNATVVTTLAFSNSLFASLPRTKASWEIVNSGENLWTNIIVTGGTLHTPVVRLLVKKFIVA